VLGRYVREQQVVTLEDAVRKMTSLAARNMGLRDRGTITAGAKADLVLFSPDSIIDRATTTKPQTPAAGVRMVWVNGEVVYQDARPPAAFPGGCFASAGGRGSRSGRR
jgi:N-acyl-D-aspartate/D-glutamate deacylase